MLPDDCYRIPELMKSVENVADHSIQEWNNKFLRLCNVCRLLGVVVAGMGTFPQFRACVQMAQDRVNKKWSP